MAEVRAALAASALVLAFAGCTPGAPTERRPAERTTTMSTPAVRTDREPIAKRFPQLRDFIEVHWQGSAPGDATWQVSEQFAADVRTTRYSGSVYLDITSGTVFIDVIGR